MTVPSIHRIRPLAFSVAAFLAWTVPVQAQDAQTCIGKQLKSASKACKLAAKCHAAVMKAGAGDPSACVAAVQEKLAAKLTKIEAKGGCVVEDAAVGNVGDMLSASAVDVATILAVAGGSCSAAKMGAYGSRCAADLKCNAIAAAAGTDVDDACSATAAQKFEGSFAKAEAKGGCATTGDASAVVTIASTAVEETVDYLSGVTTTTSNTAPPSTTTTLAPTTTTLPPTTTTLPPTTTTVAPTTTTLPPPECAVAADCPGTDSQCRYRACVDGVCGFANAAIETPCDDAAMKCNGAGACVHCTNAATDCLDPLASCYSWSCFEGYCTAGYSASGTPVYDEPCNCMATFCDGSGGTYTDADPDDCECPPADPCPPGYVRVGDGICEPI